MTFNETVLAVERRLIEKGMIFEAGFASFQATAVEEATAEEIEVAKAIFYAGAHYCLAMMVTHCSTGDANANEKSLLAMNAELDRWTEALGDSYAAELKDRRTKNARHV